MTINNNTIYRQIQTIDGWDHIPSPNETSNYPTKGFNNYALWIDSGNSRFDGVIFGRKSFIRRLYERIFKKQ